MRAGQAQILCVAGDPGGAAALAPVISLLEELPAITCHLFSYYKADNVFLSAGLASNDLSIEINTDRAAELISDLEIDLLLTGTSDNQFNLEKVFIQGARKVNVPSLAVLDFWSNYSKRFSLEDEDLACLPDRIAVMDQLAVNEMEKEGIAISRIRITGQPGFDELALVLKEINSAELVKVRGQLGARPEDLVVVFISQPLSVLFGIDEIGYDEKSIFLELVEALDRIGKEKSRDSVLVILPHLRDQEPWWIGTGIEELSVLAASREDFPRIAMAADLVTGMTSTKLVEAAILGRKTISLQVGAKEGMVFDITRLGVNDLVIGKDQVVERIQELLFSGSGCGVNIPVHVDGQAADNVVALIQKMLAEGAGSISGADWEVEG